MSASSSNPIYLCFGFNNQENRDLLSSWLKGKPWRHIDLVGLRVFGQSISDDDLDFALKSARRVPPSQFGQLTKRLFLRWQYHWVYRKLTRSKCTHVLNYNGLKGVNYLVTVAARQLNLNLLFWELAPLPDRMQIDHAGINYESSIPRDISFYRQLDINRFPDSWRTSPLQLRQPHRKSKIQHVEANEETLSNEKYVFCPFQVPTDSQITIYGGWIKNLHFMIECLSKLSEKLPKEFHFRIKEHPSSPIALTDEIQDVESEQLRLDNQTNTLDLMRHATCVLTVNSSAGLEAFHYGKPVITLGKAFYSFGELTERADSFEQLTDIVKRIDQVSFSATDRDLFLRFIYSWFPTRESIQTGEYSEKDLQARDSLLSAKISTPG